MTRQAFEMESITRILRGDCVCPIVFSGLPHIRGDILFGHEVLSQSAQWLYLTGEAWEAIVSVSNSTL